MSEVSLKHLDEAIQAVMEKLNGISELYPSQYEILTALIQHKNLFYTNATNSGKTLPTVIFPDIIKHLNTLGYKFPSKPKLLFLTALNSLQLSLMNNTKALGILCEAINSENIKSLIDSNVSVLFVSPEILKLHDVTQTLLSHRSTFVLKVVDECHLGKQQYMGKMYQDTVLALGSLTVAIC